MVERVDFVPHSAPPSTVFDNFFLDPHIMSDLPAKHWNLSPQILDFAGMEEQQGNQNHPSIRCSFSKECFEKHALLAKIQP
jgi:hypothetical protein